MFQIPRSTLQHWLSRARDRRLDRVDWDNRPPIPRATRRTPASMERLILKTRERLLKHSALGEHGAAAIRRELLSHAGANLPSVRTIGRILERGGVLDGRRRIRRPAPPPAWYLPEVATGRLEMDSFDFIEDLAIRGVCPVVVLNAISLHGGLAQSWPARQMSAPIVLECLVQHWRQQGLAGYAQFDNDMRFQGPHSRPGVLSRVVRMCLSLGVVPVFTPPRETGFQAAIENFNGRWQKAVWVRFTHRRLSGLQEHSERFIAAFNVKTAVRQENAPKRRDFPNSWQLDLKARPRGRMIFLRRTNAGGQVGLLGYQFEVCKSWLQRLVRAEVDLSRERVQFFALRRRDPTAQPLLNEVAFNLQEKIFLD